MYKCVGSANDKHSTMVGWAGDKDENNVFKNSATI